LKKTHSITTISEINIRLFCKERSRYRRSHALRGPGSVRPRWSRAAKGKAEGCGEALRRWYKAAEQSLEKSAATPH
jgi:hypothetical protein